MTNNWRDIIGHREIIQRLQQMTKAGRRPHAFLFSGPNGVGKNLVARVFAAALLCRTAAPCGTCFACRQLEAGSHPDFHRIAPDGASIKIEQIRSLQKEIALAPYGGGCRVVMIDGAEKMTPPAANSLLKTLEEPEGDSVFILLTAARQSMLPTVLSRCMQLHFQPPELAEVEALLERDGIAPELAATAARLGGGCPGRALQFAAPDGLDARNQALEWLARLAREGLPAAWTLAAQWDKMERHLFMAQLDGLAVCLRDLMVLTVTGGAAAPIVNVDAKAALGALLPHWSEQTLATAWHAVENARRASAANANIRLTGESLLIRLQDLME